MNQATTNYYNDYILLEWQNFVSDPSRAPEARVHFLRGSAEDLSFPDGVFDAVICRLALPYTDNSQALAEASRVLRRGGQYLLKIHAARFYLDLLKRAIKSRN